MIPEFEWWQWAIGIFVAFIFGGTKTGIPGLGIVASPMVVLMVGDAREAAGWVLPTSCIADLFAIYYFRRQPPSIKLTSLAPSVLAGMAVGTATFALDEVYMRPILGALILFLLLGYLYQRRYGVKADEDTPTAPYGLAAGFATVVANASGSVMNIYLLRKNLPRQQFLATGAWFFFVLNLLKFPIYGGYGLFSKQSLTYNLITAPVVLIGSLSGRWVVQHIPQNVFEVLVVALTASATILLFR